MADANLDDFFAKKDKGKKKQKKQPTDDEVAKKTKVPKKKKEKKIEKENGEDEPQTQTRKEVDNEWNDFEEEKGADLTGLRIAPLQKVQDNDEDEENGDEDEDGEDGDTERKPKTQEGPWSKSSDKGEYHPPPAEPEPVKSAAPVLSGKYVPPSHRSGGAASLSSAQKQRRKKEMPNLRSDFDFPTLSGACDSKNDGGGNFEEVRGSGSNRQTEDLSKRTQRLELGNKFSALTDQ